MEIVIIIIGTIAGLAIGFLVAKQKSAKVIQTEKEISMKTEREFITQKAKTESEIEFLIIQIT